MGYRKKAEWGLPKTSYPSLCPEMMENMSKILYIQFKDNPVYVPIFLFSTYNGDNGSGPDQCD